MCYNIVGSNELIVDCVNQISVNKSFSIIAMGNIFQFPTALFLTKQSTHILKCNRIVAPSGQGRLFP
jgi:hypothetical protein